MRDNNGYVTASLAGVKAQSDTTRQVKCSISFPHELQRVSTLMNHDSLTLGKCLLDGQESSHSSSETSVHLSFTIRP